MGIERPTENGKCVRESREFKQICWGWRWHLDCILQGKARRAKVSK
jgi:hypothetical protein